MIYDNYLSSIQYFPVTMLDETVSFQRDILNIHLLPGQFLFPHWNEEFTFIYILSGTMEFRIRQKAYLVSSGEAFFLNVGEIFSACSYQPTYDCRFVIYRIRPSLLFQSEESSLYQTYIKPLIEQPSFGYQTLVSKIPWQKYILETIRKMNEILDKKMDGYELKIQHFINEVFYYIFHNIDLSKQLSLKEIRDLSRMKEIMTYLNETIDQKHTLSEISNFCHLSPSECCRLFQRNVHLSPMDYLNQLRIYHSLPEILKHEKKMGEISCMVGFSGSSYFSEMFKKTLGITPRAFYKSYHEHLMINSDPTHGKR